MSTVFITKKEKMGPVSERRQFEVFGSESFDSARSWLMLTFMHHFHTGQYFAQFAGANIGLTIDTPQACWGKNWRYLCKHINSRSGRILIYSIVNNCHKIIRLSTRSIKSVLCKQCALSAIILHFMNLALTASKGFIILSNIFNGYFLLTFG